jgi:hypothetical protein
MSIQEVGGELFGFSLFVLLEDHFVSVFLLVNFHVLCVSHVFPFCVKSDNTIMYFSHICLFSVLVHLYSRILLSDAIVVEGSRLPWVHSWVFESSQCLRIRLCSIYFPQCHGLSISVPYLHKFYFNTSSFWIHSLLLPNMHHDPEYMYVPCNSIQICYQ